MTFEQDDSCLRKIKITLPSIVIIDGSGTPAISKMELFTLKAVNFWRRELDLRQALACNIDPRSSSKI